MRSLSQTAQGVAASGTLPGSLRCLPQPACAELAGRQWPQGLRVPSLEHCLPPAGRLLTAQWCLLSVSALEGLAAKMQLRLWVLLLEAPLAWRLLDAALP